MVLPEDRINFKSRLTFLTDVTALEFLCSPEAVTRLEGAVESLNQRISKTSFVATAWPLLRPCTAS